MELAYDDDHHSCLLQVFHGSTNICHMPSNCGVFYLLSCLGGVEWFHRTLLDILHWIALTPQAKEPMCVLPIPEHGHSIIPLGTREITSRWLCGAGRTYHESDLGKNSIYYPILYPPHSQEGSYEDALGPWISQLRYPCIQHCLKGFVFLFSSVYSYMSKSLWKRTKEIITSIFFFFCLGVSRVFSWCTLSVENWQLRSGNWESDPRLLLLWLWSASWSSILDLFWFCRLSNTLICCSSVMSLRMLCCINPFPSSLWVRPLWLPLTLPLMITVIPGLLLKVKYCHLASV